MAHRQVMDYTCDRCGRKAVAEAGDDGKVRPPLGWTNAGVEALNVGERDSDTSAELCAGCSLQIRRYMQPVNAPDNAVYDRAAVTAAATADGLLGG